MRHDQRGMAHSRARRALAHGLLALAGVALAGGTGRAEPIQPPTDAVFSSIPWLDGKAGWGWRDNRERSVWGPEAQSLLSSSLPFQEDSGDAAPAAADASTRAGTQSSADYYWTKTPPLQLPLPRTGFFILSPSGPGYYSFRDLVTGNWREAPPIAPLPPLSSNPYPFFEANYRYLDDPANTQFDFFDPIKRMHPGSDWLLSMGGEERLRFMGDLDYARLTNVYNPHLLDRTRLYTDLWYLDLFRVYVEAINARTSPQRLPPLANDVDNLDIWNLFIDWKMWDFDDKPVYLRVGRQNLYFGSQRLVGPSDWSNVPRTFQGVRGMYQGDQWSVDAFWVNPVAINPTGLDSPERNQNFAGFWSTYRPRQGQSVDLYYLFLNQTQPVAVGQDGIRGGYDVSTWGSRYSGDSSNFLWDFEGMGQLGNWSNQSIAAGAATTGLGYRFADAPLNPNFWTYFDYASGDPHPGGNTRHTFDQIFPWGHTYFGYLDLVGRQNILDPNLQLTLNPTNWILVGLQGHFFYLASPRDALYNASGAQIYVDPTGKSGTHVGDELDVYTNIHLTTHQDLLIGYSHMFSGEVLRHAGVMPQPNLFYVQYSFKW